MDALGGSANGIRASEGGQAVQMERVVAACKVPKDGVVADVDGQC